MTQSFHITDRDFEILQAVGRYRFLQTGQIKRLLFSNNSTAQTARRRLRHLLAGGFLKKTAPPPDIRGHGSSEDAFFLSMKGRIFLEQAGHKLPLYSNKKAVSPLFLRHALAVSEFYLTADQALSDHPLGYLRRSIADFEIKENLGRNVKGLARHALFHEFTDTHSKDGFIVYPDLVLILQGKGKFKDERRIYCVEIDMGTESMAVIKRKIIGYALAAQSGLFNKFGVKDFRVLLQTTKKTRMENIQKAAIGMAGIERFSFSYASQIDAHGVFERPVWQDGNCNPQTLFLRSAGEQ